MAKKCDLCSKRIGLFVPEAHEALKDGLCLCKKCYTSFWEKHTDPDSQTKDLARIALSGELRPEVKSIVVKHIKELIQNEEKAGNTVESISSSSSKFVKFDLNTDVVKTTQDNKEREAHDSEVKISHEKLFEIEKESDGIADSVDATDETHNQDLNNVVVETAEDNIEQKLDDEVIIISYEMLCEIETVLKLDVKYLWSTFGRCDLEFISIEENSLYEQIKNLDEEERSCHLILEAQVNTLIYFRKLLNHSNGINDMILLPLWITADKDAGKVFLFKPDDIISFVQYQHKSVNFVQTVKEDPTILASQYKESGALDFDMFVHDMIFLETQVQLFTERILELIGVTVTNQDELGRITNIRYNG